MMAPKAKGRWANKGTSKTYEEGAALPPSMCGDRQAEPRCEPFTPRGHPAHSHNNLAMCTRSETKQSIPVASTAMSLWQPGIIPSIAVQEAGPAAEWR